MCKYDYFDDTPVNIVQRRQKTISEFKIITSAVKCIARSDKLRYNVYKIPVFRKITMKGGIFKWR
ncbi:hypothetical protein CUS_6905 [Ruminococcus albus 8]|uniref:Uncharacterized protein n=1 Tax=Ruminococcus albus 8 TaxID=246199 RepID=E9SC88_RUMAL|nr:hypothetical protein CUS_6905 [Ruminococcus albus 8]